MFTITGEGKAGRDMGVRLGWRTRENIARGEEGSIDDVLLSQGAHRGGGGVGLLSQAGDATQTLVFVL